MKAGVSPAVAVIIVVVVIAIVVAVGWKLTLGKKASTSAPKSPDDTKTMMQQKGMMTTPMPKSGDGHLMPGSASGEQGAAPPGGDARQPAPTGG